MDIVSWVATDQECTETKGAKAQVQRCVSRSTQQSVFHSHSRCVAKAPLGLPTLVGGRQPKWPSEKHPMHDMPCVGNTIHIGEKKSES